MNLTKNHHFIMKLNNPLSKNYKTIFNKITNNTINNYFNKITCNL